MIFYRKTYNIQAISFDLDDTLYDNYPIMRRAEAKLISFMSEQFDSPQLAQMSFWLTIKRQWLKDMPELSNDMGELRLRTLKSGFIECGYSEAEAQLHAHTCFDYFYHQRSDFTVDTEVTTVLEKLAELVPLVGITNGNVNLETVGIDRFFTECFHAKLYQPMKPHRKMFDLTRQVLNLPAENILHVGDNLEKDIMGAKNAGFSAAWYACDRPMDLQQEPTTVLPDVQLTHLHELLNLV